MRTPRPPILLRDVFEDVEAIHALFARHAPYELLQGRRQVMASALEQGMFILTAGPDFNIIRFIPPLIATIEEIDHGIDILDKALTAYEAL